MKLYPLLMLTVSGLTSGQRDLVVNRRARQNIPRSQQTDRFESAGHSPAPSDPFSSYRSSSLPSERRSSRARTRTDVLNDPSYISSDVLNDPSYTDATPYYELGGSARQRVRTFQDEDRYSGGRTSSSDSSTPYFESGASQRQGVSEEQYQVLQRSYYDPSSSASASAEDPALNLVDTGDSSHLDRFTNVDRAASRHSPQQLDATERRDIVVSAPVAAAPASSSTRSRVRASNLIRRRIDVEVPQVAAADPTPAAPRRSLTRVRSRTDFDRFGDRSDVGYSRESSYNDLEDDLRSVERSSISRGGRYPTSPSSSSASTRQGRVTSRTRSRFRSSNSLSRGQPEPGTISRDIEPTSSRTIDPRQRTRGRSRFSSGRTVPEPEDTTRYEASRPNLRYKPRPETTRQDSSRNIQRPNRRIDVESNSIRDEPNYKQVFRIKFPKKDLIPGVPKVSFSEKKVEVGDAHNINRFSTEIKPTKPRPTPVPEEPEEGPPELQSSRQDRDDIIVVTHKVPAKTVFTVIEDRETKSLYIDTYTTSLQEVSIRDLKSTYIDENPVIYAHSSITNGFGVQETLFDGIHPTRTVIDVYTDRYDELSTEYSTIYNVQTVTVRKIEEIEAEPAAGLSPLAPDLTQIGSLLQTVILGLLGGNILGSNVQQQGGLAGQQTNVITHTRSFVTTTTSVDTILVPVTYRGSEIFQTVSDTRTKVFTATDYSVQTLVQPGLATTSPFLPLAPTLHRATRVVPTYNPLLPALLGAAPLGGGLHQPTPSLTLITHTSTRITTLDTEITSDIVITLGGREVQTQFIQPTQAVVTLTSESTQTVTVSPGQQSPASPVSNTLNQLSVLRAILQLQG